MRVHWVCFHWSGGDWVQNLCLSVSTPLLTGRPNRFDELDWYLDVTSSSLLDLARRFWNQCYKGEKQTKTLARYSSHYFRTSFMLECMQRLTKIIVHNQQHSRIAYRNTGRRGRSTNTICLVGLKGERKSTETFCFLTK